MHISRIDVTFFAVPGSVHHVELPEDAPVIRVGDDVLLVPSHRPGQPMMVGHVVAEYIESTLLGSYDGKVPPASRSIEVIITRFKSFDDGGN
jgi:hypothetical protein